MEKVYRELDRADSRTLMGFVRAFWPIIEPAREFVPGWAMSAIAEHLEAVSRGEITRLLINVPPGFSKSLLTSVFFPAWEWGPRGLPSTRYLCASYTESLTVRDNRRCRAIVTSDRYRAAWPNVVLMGDQNQKIRFDNTETGWKLASSVGGVGTGERGDRVIIDDAISVRDAESDVKLDSALQWFTEVIPTRINDAGKSSIIVIMQRVHERDIAGHILDSTMGYDVLTIPMEYDSSALVRSSIGWTDPRAETGETYAWPERFSEQYIEEQLKPELRSWGGDYAVSAQLQQRPAPRGGGMFKRDKFSISDSPGRGGQVFRGWDLAASKDGRAAWTVGVKMRRQTNGMVYVEDVVRFRGGPDEVEATIRQTAETDGPSVRISLPQDPGQAGLSQKAALAKKLEGYDFKFSPESGSKEDRARPLAAQVNSGMVSLVRAPWNDVFLSEFASFPMSKFKDQVDAASRAYSELIRKKAPIPYVGPEIIR